MENDILLEKVEGHVGTLILNRPERRNALSQDLLLKIHLKLKEWAETDDVRAVVITGSGDKAFSSGYDIMAIPTEVTEEMKAVLKEHNPLELALNSVKNYPYPTIAMLNGYAFGAGFNMAVCCDIRIAKDTVKMGMPPAKLGLIYHPEGIKQFVEALGMARTREVFFTARTYSPEEVKRMGLVDHMVPAGELLEKTYGYANEIAQNAPLSLKGTKTIIRMLSDAVTYSDAQMQEAERIITEGFNSDDLKEGQTAFIEKRKPVFQGK